MKYTEEYLNQICAEKDLSFIGFSYQIRDKKRRCADFICNKHKSKGIQSRPVEKMEAKKPCQYCNHTFLSETLQEEISVIHPNIIVQGHYIDYDTPIDCYCTIHNHTWKASPKALFQKEGCPLCGFVKRWDSRGRITTHKFKERISSLYPDIKIIGEYKGTHELIRCKCRIHNTIWESYACNILNGTATCPTCSEINRAKSQQLSDDEYKKRVYNTFPHIIPVSQYDGMDNEVIVHCINHNIDFTTTPRNLFKHGGIRGCPLCYQSLGEKKLITLLLNKGREISTQHIFDGCVYKMPLRFDAYDLNNNIAYEYQGQQHYYPVCFNGDQTQAENEFEEGQIRDTIKEQYCFEKNITLVKIPYWDIDNMDKYIY